MATPKHILSLLLSALNSNPFLTMSVPKNMTAKQHDKYWRDVTAKRMRGLYQKHDTIDETEVCVRAMEPSDVVFTLIHRLGAFSVYNNREFLPQVAEWKRLGCVLLDTNVFERTIAGKQMYMFIIQPSDISKSSISPLALAYDVLVSGYAYLTPHKSTVELVKRALQQN